MCKSEPSKPKRNTPQSFAKKILAQFSNKNVSQTPNIKKYGEPAIVRNAKRLAEITKHHYKKDELEIRYRMDIQNYYVLFGKLPDHFIEP
ncbi:MAG: hypothetical protein QCH99_04695 [Candidatus Bathyarchaeota archaeon]|nr:hypothetical protein [Candidatus Bathyarchaeum tardum]